MSKGTRLFHGTWTLTPLSPVSPQRYVEVDETGDTMTDPSDPPPYHWDPALGGYKRQDPGEPPGGWRWYVFQEGSGDYDRYEAMPPLMSPIWTETGAASLAV